jgi:signal peptidase II
MAEVKTMEQNGSARARRAGWLIAVAALILDQASKNLLLYGFDFGRLGPLARIVILPFLDLVMVWNRGVSYGLLQAGSITGTVLLTGFSLIAVMVLSWWLTRADRLSLTAGLGLIIGGALGNVIDRILYGAVADFFHFHAFGRDWYVFNVADAAITVGVIVLLIDAFLRPETRSEGKRQSGT